MAATEFRQEFRGFKLIGALGKFKLVMTATSAWHLFGRRAPMRGVAARLTGADRVAFLDRPPGSARCPTGRQSRSQADALRKNAGDVSGVDSDSEHRLLGLTTEETSARPALPVVTPPRLRSAALEALLAPQCQPARQPDRSALASAGWLLKVQGQSLARTGPPARASSAAS